MIRKQPEEGMSLLIDEYGGMIKTSCSNVLRNYDEDIVQDAMAAVATCALTVAPTTTIYGKEI